MVAALSLMDWSFVCFACCTALLNIIVLPDRSALRVLVASSRRSANQLKAAPPRPASRRGATQVTCCCELYGSSLSAGSIRPRAAAGTIYLRVAMAPGHIHELGGGGGHRAAFPVCTSVGAERKPCEPSDYAWSHDEPRARVSRIEECKAAPPRPASQPLDRRFLQLGR